MRHIKNVVANGKAFNIVKKVITTIEIIVDIVVKLVSNMIELVCNLVSNHFEFIFEIDCF